MLMIYFNIKDKFAIKDFYKENGYVVIKNILNNDFTDQIINEVYYEDFPARIQDLWKDNEIVRKVAGNKIIFNLLKFIYNDTPLPFQTLNFKSGTTQKPHTDLVHFCPSEDDLSLMCGVWYAFEDIDDSKGPLIFYPKSHKLPYMIDCNEFENYNEYEDFMEKYIIRNNMKFEKANLEKGSVIIWDSNLIHGGHEFKEENSTRYSMVTHYFFKKSKYWWTPILSKKDEIYYRKKSFIKRNARKILQD